MRELTRYTSAMMEELWEAFAQVEMDVGCRAQAYTLMVATHNKWHTSRLASRKGMPSKRIPCVDYGQQKCLSRSVVKQMCSCPPPNTSHSAVVTQGIRKRIAALTLRMGPGRAQNTEGLQETTHGPRKRARTRCARAAVRGKDKQ
jgi:hypothetical protein